jgi:hypothetical protein
MSQHLTTRDKEAIRRSVVASRGILDARVSAKRIADEYVGVLPTSVGPGFRAEAFEFALIVVRDYRAELMMDLLPDL